MPGSQPRILLIDDDIDLVALMTEFLSAQGFEVRAAHDGPSGLREALSGADDVILLDVMLPGFDGFEVLRRLRAKSDIPVLMLTARTEAASRVLGLDEGADDYIPKPCEPMELAARIRAILRRSRRPAPNGALEISGVRLEPATRRVFADGHPVDLTSIEYDILEALMRSAGRVVTRDELMQRLYQRQATAFDRAVDVHISHLRRKLEGPVERICTVRGAGYQFVLEPVLSRS